jgi:RNA polymerase sigma factor (TIGR02999 family)
MTSSSQDVTELLDQWRNGNKSALDALLPLVYNELHSLAHRHIRGERADHTLQTTALVNEAYLKLINQKTVSWQNRAHFFAVAAQVMRHILVDYARARRYSKRGGGAHRVSLDDAPILSRERSSEIVALDEALKRLADFDERKSRIVEMRYFGGLSVEETAAVLGVSAITVKREWLKARAWLYRELSGGK